MLGEGKCRWLPFPLLFCPAQLQPGTCASDAAQPEALSFWGLSPGKGGKEQALFLEHTPRGSYFLNQAERIQYLESHTVPSLKGVLGKNNFHHFA